jgi:hypothetical protein
MVRARKKDNNALIRTAIAIAIASEPRSLRTVRVKSRSLMVSSSWLPSFTGVPTGEDRRQVGGIAHLMACFAARPRGTELGPGAGQVRLGLGEILDLLCTDQGIEGAVEGAGDGLIPRLGRRVAKLIGRSTLVPAVRQPFAVRVVKPDTGLPRSRHALDEVASPGLRHCRQRPGDKLRLTFQLACALLLQLLRKASR